MSCDDFLRRFLSSGVPNEHKSIVNGGGDAPSRVLLPPRITHGESFVEPSLTVGVSAWSQLLGYSTRPALAPLRRVGDAPTMLFVNAHALVERSAPPLHSRSMCLWSSRTSLRRYALVASHRNRARLTAVPLDALASLDSSLDVDAHVDRVLARSALLSHDDKHAIIDVAAQSDVPSLNDAPSAAFVATITADRVLTVLRLAEQSVPVERLLIDHEASASTGGYRSASFTHRSSDLPALHAVWRDALHHVRSRDGDSLVVEAKISSFHAERPLFAAPTAVPSNAIVCSRSTVFSVDWRVPKGAVSAFASRLLRRWPRRPEELVETVPNALKHRITAVAASNVPYLFATALEDETQAFACVELWDERNRLAPVDRWRWPTGRESAMRQASLRRQRGHDIDALGTAPSALAFVTSDDSSRIELFAVDGSRTRIVALRADSDDGRMPPVAASDVVSVPTFWESLRNFAPFATSAADAITTANPRSEAARALVARDGIDRAKSPLVQGIALARLDNDTIACIQLNTDGDVYRAVMTRATRPPLTRESAEPRRAVRERLEALRVERDLKRTDSLNKHFLHVKFSDFATAQLGAALHDDGIDLLGRASSVLREHPCSLDELVRKLRCDVQELVRTLVRAERQGHVASMARTVASGVPLLDQLQTVYYVPGSETTLPPSRLQLGGERAATEDVAAATETEDAAATTTGDREDSQVVDEVLTQMSQPYLDDNEIAAQARAAARASVIEEDLERRRGRKSMFVPDSNKIDTLARDWQSAFGASSVRKRRRGEQSETKATKDQR